MATNVQMTAFVTGSSSGIGRAAALALRQAGYQAIGTSRSAAPGARRFLPRVLFDRSLRKQFNIA
jgi:NAD(P)-dependent dehydrogenase (short-subunit alcohol dehydrogenase family)